MGNITLHAHYDGSQIQLDEPHELQPDTKLLVTVIRSDAAEDAAWTKFSQQGLAAAYGDAEPECSLNMLREPNPSCERG